MFLAFLPLALAQEGEAATDAAAALPGPPGAPVADSILGPPPPPEDGAPRESQVNPPGGLSLVRGGLRTVRFGIGKWDLWVPTTLALEVGAELSLMQMGTAYASPHPTDTLLPFAALIFTIPTEVPTHTSESNVRAAGVRHMGRTLIVAESSTAAWAAWTAAALTRGAVSGETASVASGNVAMFTGAGAAWWTSAMRSRRHGGVALWETCAGIAVIDAIAIGGTLAVQRDVPPGELALAAATGTLLGVTFPLLHL